MFNVRNVRTGLCFAGQYKGSQAQGGRRALRRGLRSEGPAHRAGEAPSHKDLVTFVFQRARLIAKLDKQLVDVYERGGDWSTVYETLDRIYVLRRVWRGQSSPEKKPGEERKENV